MDDRNAGGGQAFPQSRPQTERALGRGLADISHLFLSQASDESDPERGARGGLLKAIQTQQPEPALVTALNPLSRISRDQLVSLLKEHPALLEEGLHPIDSDIRFHACGPIDLLAVDDCGRLVVVDVDVSPNDNMLMRGIYHCDWLVSNAPIVRRMYREMPIDYASNPRLFLVAPDFSALHRSVTSWISNPHIRCFKYHAVAMHDGAGILVEQT